MSDELGPAACNNCGTYSSGRLFTPEGPLPCCGKAECSMAMSIQIAMQDTDDLRDLR